MKSIKSGFLQLVVLTGAMILSVGAWLFGSVVLGWQVVLGAVLLVACWSLRTMYPSSYRLMVLVTLLAAAVEVALFLPVSVLVGFTWTIAGHPLRIGFHPLFGPIFLYTLWIWRDELRGYVSGPPPGHAERERAKRVSIDGYKRRLTQSTSEDLRRRLSERDGFVPNARVAAEELLLERDGDSTIPG